MNTIAPDKAVVAVIVSYFSDFFFEILKAKPNQLELSIIVILVTFEWLVGVTKIQNSKIKIQFLERNKDLRQVLSKLIYFITSFLVFSTVRVVIEFLRNSFGASEPTLFEAVVGAFVLLSLGYLVIQIFGNIK